MPMCLLLGLGIGHIDPINRVTRLLTDKLSVNQLIGHIGNWLNWSIKPVFVSFLLNFLLVANWTKN
jgi:hypothetical protein